MSHESTRGFMVNYRLDATARDDLDGIYDHIAFDSISAADRLMGRFHRKFALLATQPLMGELRPDLAPQLRSFVIGNYVILYRPAGQTSNDGGIEVARILHASRDIASLF